MSIRHVFLDMDGVLTDFVTATLKVHDALDLLEGWPPGEFNFAKVLGISNSQFWSKIDALGYRFWAEMPCYDWMDELLEVVQHHAPFSILSTPSRSPESPMGKVQWLRRHLQPNFKEFLIGQPKYHCAKPDTVLIDDHDSNVDSFREHEGRAILFPQPWNSNHAIVDRIEFVADQLRQIAADD